MDVIILLVIGRLSDYYKIERNKDMAFTTFCSQRVLNINELREVLALMEQQESTDRYVNTVMHINGNYAEIDVGIDKDGNVTVF